jgi:hypothetical protein
MLRYLGRRCTGSAKQFDIGWQSLSGALWPLRFFASNQLKAQQPNRVVLAEAKNHLQTYGTHTIALIPADSACHLIVSSRWCSTSARSSRGAVPSNSARGRCKSGHRKGSGVEEGGGGCFWRDCVRHSLGKCSLSTAPWVLCFPGRRPGGCEDLEINE